MLRRSGISLSALTCLAALGLASCTTESEMAGRGATPTESTATTLAPTDPPAERARLTYGVFGNEPELRAYQTVVDDYNAGATTVEVTLESWPTSAAMMRAITRGEADPDIYQVTRDQLTDVVDEGRNVPLFSLLEDRNLSYGDNYPLDTIEALSRGNDLQCMPYGISPTVMYFNTDLIDFDTMRLRGLPTPEDEMSGWDFEEFAAAAEFGTHKRAKSRGLTIEPTLAAIAPYLYSGGGSLFDDDMEPTSLDLSSDENRETLETLLTLARNPLVTLTDTQLRKATPLEWFERGRLAMLQGERSLTPGLRKVPDLDFDVMPMPRIGRTATTGDVTGICIAPGDSVQRSADFLVHLISAKGFEPVAEAGYTVPANTAVARSVEFLQPNRQPEHAGAFNASVDAMELLPLEAEDPELLSAVGGLVEQLFTMTLPPDIEVATELIDATSRAVLDPTYEPEPSELPADSSEPTEPSESSDSSTP